MSGNKRDITTKIKRLEPLEERLGILLEGLSAWLEDHRDEGEEWSITLHGELHSRTGPELSGDIDLVVSAYDESQRVIGTTTAYVSREGFFGLHTFAIGLSIPLEPARLRIYPKSLGSDDSAESEDGPLL